MPALPLTGGCVCGAVRYEVRAAPFLISACHCTDCQKRTGAAYSMNMPVTAGAFAIVAGEPLESVQPTPSGFTTTHVYCPQCFARVASKPHKLPDYVSVRPGTLDDTSWLTPSMHIYTRSAQPGAILPGVPTFDGDPPADTSSIVAAFRALWNSLP